MKSNFTLKANPFGLAFCKKKQRNLNRDFHCQINQVGE